MTHTWPLIPDVPFPNWLGPTYLEVKKVHKVQIVQKTEILTQILI